MKSRNTVEFLNIWKMVYNPVLNHGEFAIIKSQALKQPVLKIEP